MKCLSCYLVVLASLVFCSSTAEAQIVPQPNIVAQCNQVNTDSAAAKVAATNERNTLLAAGSDYQTMPFSRTWYDANVGLMTPMIQMQCQMWMLSSENYYFMSMESKVSGDSYMSLGNTARNNGDAKLLLGDYGTAMSWYYQSLSCYTAAKFDYFWAGVWAAGCHFDDLVMHTTFSSP